MKRTLLLGACYLAVLGGTSIARGADLPDVADLIIYNAKVLTMNSNFTVASAIAVKDGKILAVGRDRKLEEYRGPETRTVDAQERIVMPGLYDADVSSYVMATSDVKRPQPDFDSISNAQAYIRREASNTPAGTWIVLDFVSPLRLKESRLPTKDELDAVTTNHPVLWNFGPNAVVNTMALTVSRIDKDTQAPPKGEIVKDPRHHNPTGLLRNATSVLKLPKPDKPATAAQERAALKHLYQLYNQQGITSISETVSSTNAIDLFRDMASSNELTVRINCGRYFSPSADADESIDRLTAFTNAAAGKLPYGPTGIGDDWVKIGPLQTSIDGDAGYGTAYLRTPYGIGPTYMNDELAYRGLLLQDRYALPLVFITAAQQGWQLETHAAGDAALDFVLNAYEQASFKFDLKDKRYLIASPEFQAAQDWVRCQNLGVGVILKPTLLYDDGASLEKTLGDKRLTYYMPFKGWFDRGIVAGGGSGHYIGLDSRNTPHAWNPWLGMWITLTRQTRQGAEIGPEEKLTREQAVRLYTFNNAWLHNEDNVKGSLEPGKLADLIMLDTDILKCPLSDIPNTKVLLTLVNGKPVWQSVEPIFPGPQVIQSVTVNAPLQPVNVAAPSTVNPLAPVSAVTTPAATSSSTTSSQPAETATKHAAEATTAVNPYAPVSDAPAAPAAAPTATRVITPVATPAAWATTASTSASTTATTPATTTVPASTSASTSPAAPAAATVQTTSTSQTTPQTTPAPASNVTAPVTAPAPEAASTPASAPATSAAPANVAPPVATAPIAQPAAKPAATTSDAGFTSIAGAAPAEAESSQSTASAASTVTNQAPAAVTNAVPGTISTNAANAFPANPAAAAAATTTAPTQGGNAAETAQAAPAATGAAQVAATTWDKTSGATTSSTNSAAGNQDWSRVNGAK